MDLKKGIEQKIRALSVVDYAHLYQKVMELEIERDGYYVVPVLEVDIEAIVERKTLFRVEVSERKRDYDKGQCGRDCLLMEELVDNLL